MHVNLVIPPIILIGFLSVAYPAIGALMNNFLTRVGKKRLGGVAVSLLSFFWPLTILAGVVAFPFWVVGWLGKNYGQAARVWLANGTPAKESVAFFIGQKVRVVRNPASIKAQYPNLVEGSVGHVKNQVESNYQVTILGVGDVWVPEECLTVG